MYKTDLNLRNITQKGSFFCKMSQFLFKSNIKMRVKAQRTIYSLLSINLVFLSHQMFSRSLKCATCLGAWQALVVEGRGGSLSALAALRRMNAKSSRREPLSHFAAPVQIGGLVDIHTHTTCSGQPKNLFTHTHMYNRT